MSLTSIIKPFFKSRVGAIRRYDTEAEEIQRQVLAHLLCKDKNNE